MPFHRLLLLDLALYAGADSPLTSCRLLPHHRDGSLTAVIGTRTISLDPALISKASTPELIFRPLRFTCGRSAVIFFSNFFHCFPHPQSPFPCCGSPQYPIVWNTATLAFSAFL
jgi:hypothetical protein